MKNFLLWSGILVFVNCDLWSQWSIGLPLQFCYSPVTGEQQNNFDSSYIGSRLDSFDYGNPERALKGVSFGLRVEYQTQSRITFGAQLTYTVLSTLNSRSHEVFLPSHVRKQDGTDTVIINQLQSQQQQERRSLGLDVDVAVHIISHFKVIVGLRLSSTTSMYETETLNYLDSTVFTVWPGSKWSYTDGKPSLLLRNESPKGVSKFYLGGRIGMSYDLRLTSALTISPLLHYIHAFSPYRLNSTYTANAFEIGACLKMEL